MLDYFLSSPINYAGYNSLESAGLMSTKFKEYVKKHLDKKKTLRPNLKSHTDLFFPIFQVSWIQKSSLHVLTSNIITFTGTVAIHLPIAL